MIDVKLIAKAKTGNAEGGSGTAAGGGSVNSVAEEAKHAAKADMASQAEYAERSGYATKAAWADAAGSSAWADKAAEAEHAGTADMADVAKDLTEDSPVNDRFLSAVADDIAHGVITFEEGLTAVKTARLKGGARFGEYEQGAAWTTGKGAAVDKDGNMEVESLRVRSYMECVELIVNRLSALEGDQLLTEADTIETAEELGDGVWGLTLREKWDGYHTAQAAGNVVKGIMNTMAEAAVTAEADDGVETPSHEDSGKENAAVETAAHEDGGKENAAVETAAHEDGGKENAAVETAAHEDGGKENAAVETAAHEDGGKENAAVETAAHEDSGGSSAGGKGTSAPYSSAGGKGTSAPCSSAGGDGSSAPCYYTSWMRVDEVDAAKNYIKVSLYSGEDVPGGVNYPPCSMMRIARWGNQTDETRQSCLYLSSTEGRIVKLTGVTKPILEAGNYGVTLGSLPDFVNKLTDDSGNALPLREGLDYLYAPGIVTMDVIRLNRWTRKPVVTYVDRGVWQEGGTYYCGTLNEATGVYETSEVWHKGCKYRCMKNGTAAEPSRTGTDWAVVGGYPDLSTAYEMTIDTGGDTLIGNGEEKRLVFGVRNGLMEDVTADVRTWTVTRDSGDEEADKAWGYDHADFTGTLAITLDDLRGKDKVTFTVTAYMTDEETVAARVVV